MPDIKMVYPYKPDWEPLQKVIGMSCKDYMFMGKVLLGVIWIYLYKHIITRRYLNLDGRGGAYFFENGKYHPTSIAEAITYAQS